MKRPRKPRAKGRRVRPSGLGIAFDEWLASTIGAKADPITLAKAAWVTAWADGRKHSCAAHSEQQTIALDVIISLLAAQRRTEGLRAILEAAHYDVTGVRYLTAREYERAMELVK